VWGVDGLMMGFSMLMFMGWLLLAVIRIHKQEQHAKINKSQQKNT
jgi:hypothetical protein